MSSRSAVLAQWRRSAKRRLPLLLVDVATTRDLDDPRTAAAVASAVVDGLTLDLLAVLTEADALATGKRWDILFWVGRIGEWSVGR